MKPTALIYSSHNRSNYIHNDWIVQRALEGNKRILFLPMSEGRPEGDGMDRQEWSWGTFEWFFNYYSQHGLEAMPFYWRSDMQADDIALLVDRIKEDEVVILGGGNPGRGMRRYRSVGEWYYGDSDLFNDLLHQRQNKGLLTVGFSAGVDQLCQYMGEAIEGDAEAGKGFAICRNIMALSHFEHGSMEDTLWSAAHRFGHCLVFALPNDSGLATNQGLTPGGNVWQIIHFITDNSWHWLEDTFHIKTRQGVKIQHHYSDGRHWSFNGGDTMVRLQSMDNSYTEAFIIPPGGPIIDYATQQPTPFDTVEEIIESH